jgi:hypothetical protein
MWFATDNEVLERAFYKGYSSSPFLYGMIEELWALCIRGDFVLRVVHVAGTRMIALGVDGLSRGDVELAPMSKSLRANLPLDLSPLTRAPDLLCWVQDWAPGDLRVASPYDWIYSAQLGGIYSRDSTLPPWLWDLPPGAAMGWGAIGNPKNAIITKSTETL